MSDAIQPHSEEGEQADLNWLAFRYVSGELSGEQCAEFEGILAESQPAREAVAAAVLLAEAITLAGRSLPAEAQPTVIPASVLAPKPQWRWRLARALVGAAASLLFAWGLQSWRDSGRARSPALQAPSKDGQDLSALALQWTTVGGYEPDNYEPDNIDGSVFDQREGDEPIADSRLSSPAIARDLFDDLAAPDWLLAAVATEAMPMISPDRDPNG